jgi:hypothetical protein
MKRRSKNKPGQLVIFGVLLILILIGGFFGGKAFGWWGATEMEDDGGSVYIPPPYVPYDPEDPDPIPDLEDPPEDPPDYLPLDPGSPLLYPDNEGNLTVIWKFGTGSTSAILQISTDSIHFEDVSNATSSPTHLDLPEGSYWFRVKSTNIEGDSFSSISSEFIISPEDLPEDPFFSNSVYFGIGFIIVIAIVLRLKMKK